MNPDEIKSCMVCDEPVLPESEGVRLLSGRLICPDCFKDLDELWGAPSRKRDKAQQRRLRKLERGS